MESPYNRKKEPELNKQLIIDAATDIAFETDWHQVTFQSIADRTGLSKGGIIHHFKSKEELLDELMAQSMVELTKWMIKYKAENCDKDGAMAYLQFVLQQEKDEKYIKTTRIVLQAIMINPKYRQDWEVWYQENIMPKEENISTKSLITYLIADGLWYGENMNSQTYSDEDKERILNYVKGLD